jgi:YYY domain-containing protein
LQLSPEEQVLYRQTATWSSAEVSEASWGSRLPVLAWVIVLQVIGLLALPITLITFGRLADRGYIFSKVIGLLLVAWGVWMIASVRLAPFTWWTILAVIALFAFASWLLIARHRWREILLFARMRWQLLLLEEGLFWIFFALLLAIRWGNPDLWHPGMGGEKPMDLAYLTAIVRTPYFPSYDPWFAGGYINYYYFGFVLVATLIHLTGVVPYIAYNLAVPTFFAMTAMGGFVVAFNFAEGWRSERGKEGRRWLGVGRAALLAGVSGALFVAVIGNFGQVQLLWDGLRNLSSIKADNTAWAFLPVVQFADGLYQWLSGHDLGFHMEWWYWNATRIIPPAQGEAGPINEMPFFTFLFGDLHSHMMALPYTLLAL